MRTKVIIDGLNNTQKFRAIINGVMIGDCALMYLARDRRLGKNVSGFGTNRNGIDIQVDLV